MRSRKALKLHICGRPWSVVFKHAVQDTDNTACFGTTDKSSKVIEIAVSKTTSENVGAVLLHEILHAIICTVANEHPTQEEGCVQAMEVGLVSVLRDKRNAWVWDMVVEGK